MKTGTVAAVTWNIVETIEKSRETWHCGRFSFDLREREREFEKKYIFLLTLFRTYM
jgi:hypothetical protein